MTEQFKLKPISRESIPRAIQKTERYRLINQSWAAESICRDVLEIDPDRGMGSGAMAYDAFRDAMTWYERAEAIRPAGNDDAILRWNTCARLISGHGELAPAPEPAYEPALED